MSLTRRLFNSILMAAFAGTLSLAGPAHAADPVTVFAAASLKEALDASAAAYKAETGREVVVSYAASGALAKQIEAAAPADLFVSADTKWIDWLAERKLIDAAGSRIIAANALVLVGPAGAQPVTVDPALDLAGLVGDGRLAVGERKSVPAGAYAEEALKSLGLWASVEGRLAEVENVRAALALVARGEAPLGIVYATDAKADSNVAAIGTFPAASHKPIVYPAAIVAASTNPDAAGFLDYLASDAGQKILAGYGFLPPPSGS